MEWFIALIAVMVVGLMWLAMQGRLGGMPPLVDDRPGPDLPEGPVDADDLRTVQFAVTARGYSMQQVDAVLDRLADEMDGPGAGTSSDKTDNDLGWPTLV